MSKKDKKKKKSNENKKSKKEHKKEKKHDKKKSKKDKNELKESNSITNKLTDIMGVGMVLFPQLHNDLGPILSALDEGKQFQLQLNGEKFNLFLYQLFENIPLLECNNNVWRKVIETKGNNNMKIISSIRKYILQQLLQNHNIIQPNSLLTSEQLALRAANILSSLFIKYPNLWKDINPLLLNFYEGEVVDISGIELVEVKNGLLQFFKAIGAVSTEYNKSEDYEEEEEEEGRDTSMMFTLPSKISTSQPSYKDGIDLNLLNVSDPDSSTSSDFLLNSSDSSSSSSSSDDDSDDKSDDDDKSLRDEKIVSEVLNDKSSVDRKAPALLRGPTMPSKADLLEASKIKYMDPRLYDPSDDDEEEEEDRGDIGPKVTFPTKNSSIASSSLSSREDYNSVPLGGGIVSNEVLPLSSVPVGGGDVEGESSGGKQLVAGGALQREEWMLTPGDRMPFGGDSRDPTMPSNRKFDQGKLAKKSAEAIAAQREAEYIAYINSEEGKEEEAILEEYRKKRGPSLLQKHQDDISAKRAKTGSSALSELRQKVFDRDKDFSTHRQLGSHEVNKLIEESKKLDSRFNKSYSKK